MKAEEAARLLEFVKEYDGLCKKPTKSEVRAKGIVVAVLMTMTIAFAFLTFLAFKKGWDTGIAISGAGSFVFFVQLGKAIVEYLEAKRKSKMSYAEIISEEKEREKEDEQIVYYNDKKKDLFDDDDDPTNPAGWYYRTHR